MSMRRSVSLAGPGAPEDKPQRPSRAIMARRASQWSPYIGALGAVTTRVSVVMTTFNGQAWIDRQLVSMANQTRVPDELFVCDDGSQDETLSILSRHAPNLGFPVRILHAASRSPLGTRRNLERGLRAATRADVFVIADQDDIWLPTRVETTLQALDEGHTAAFSDGYLIDVNGQRLDGTLWSRTGFTPQLRQLWNCDPVLVLARRRVATGATMAFTRRALDWALPFDETCWHDAWTLLVVAAMGGGVAAVEKPQIEYRLHGSNQVGLHPIPGRIERARHIRREGLDQASFAAQFSGAAHRVSALGGPEAAAETLRRIGAFWRRRSQPRPLAQRGWRAIVDYRAGHYSELANGWRSLLLDLLVSRSTLERATAWAGD